MDKRSLSARTESFINKRTSVLHRSTSQHASPRPNVLKCCPNCEFPLETDFLSKSRAMSAHPDAHLCKECNEEKYEYDHQRSAKSPSINWSNMNANIATWFEKAKTPEQRAVYNFLHDINNKKEIKSTPAKDLDDILNNLKKYQSRFDSPRSRVKVNSFVESSSWRVLRPTVKPQDQTKTNVCSESIFQPVRRKMNSTFLIHPNWI